VNDADQFLGGARRRTFAFRFDDLLADVVFDDLGNEAIHRATTGGGLLQQLNARRVLLKDRPLQGIDLPADATKSLYQLGSFNRRHRRAG
jgi:hypothetical protein